MSPSPASAATLPPATVTVTATEPPHDEAPGGVSRPARIKRALLLALAVLSLGVALLGVVTPGLPSTEFVLLSAWAAAKSSPRFHGWLLRNRLFGPMLRNWHQGRTVSRASKWSATLSMLACATLLFVFSPHLWLNLGAVACMLGVQWWLWRRPEP
ncbi:MAG: YbaN family protein, partial [Comamonas sp.]